ncbi:hypothetical protein EJ02DRAFT_454276 [Clathrospora elynae]|uniref:Uncharacterized protein n=1 Tax=Clathrospora elynae TaxID=706981 RepID=A0A6A5SRW0_9PLEO|nr:hypothetical protein EJ02DRAFT_454276 [Clathrospora elynae]
MFLAEARAEIAALKEEAVATSAICQLNPVDNAERSSYNRNGRAGQMQDPRSTQQTELTLVQPTTNPDRQMHYVDIDLSFLGDAIPISPSIYLSSADFIPPLPTDLDILNTNGPPPCCSDPTSSPQPDEPVNPECSTCKTRPPPDPSESTTLFAQA